MIQYLNVEVVGGALDGQSIQIAVPYGIRAMANIELSEIERVYPTIEETYGTALVNEFDKRTAFLRALTEELR